MSEERVETGPSQFGWVKLYHSSGALVTLPVPCDTRTLDCYQSAFGAISQAVAAGFSVAAPGLEQGEQKEEVLYVLRRVKQNQDNTETPIVDLYSPNDAMSWKVFTCYLNNDEQINAFERASGVKLDSLPEFPGQAAPERGAGKQTDKFIVKCPRAFAVILKANPKYDPNEQDAKKKKPKRVFVRWDGVPASTGAANGQKVDTTSTAVDMGTVGRWREFLSALPSAERLTGALKDMNGLDKYTWRAVWAIVRAYADGEGMDWDEANKKFVAPVEQQQGTGDIPF